MQYLLKLICGFFLLLLTAILIKSGVTNYYRQQYIGAIANGEVRGNLETKIFHLPTCPNYNSISKENLSIFTTADEAIKNGFDFALNCDEQVLSIRQTNDDFR